MATRNPTLEYLTTTKIGGKSQLTVPKQFREDFGLGNGAPFVVLRLGNGLILLPEQRRFEQLCEQVTARLTGAGLTPDDLQAALPEVRNRVYARRYGKRQALPDAVLEPIAPSDQPAQSPPFFGLKCPDGRNCLFLGTG
jgi:AbrB family looped-hinge helix DNA binding protein